MKIENTDLELKEECIYCDNGKYEVYSHPGIISIPSSPVDQRNTHRINDLGLNAVANNNWIILICDSCGNMQFFRPDLQE